MARIYIPKETALVKALRGFGAPNEKPKGEVSVRWESHLTRGLQYINLMRANPVDVIDPRPVTFGSGAAFNGNSWAVDGTTSGFINGNKVIDYSKYSGLTVDIILKTGTRTGVSKIAATDTGAYNAPGFQFNFDNWLVPVFLFCNNGSTWQNAKAPQLDANTIYRITGVWRPGVTIDLYIDGLDVKTSNTGTPFDLPLTDPSNRTLTYGGRPNAVPPTAVTVPFDGDVYYLAIWNRSLSEQEVFALNPSELLKPANDAPYIIGTAAAATSQYYIPKESPLVKALRGVGAPGSQPTVALKPKADAKIKAHYLGGASETDFYLPSGATFHNKGHSIVNGEQGLESTATASYVEQINLSDTVGEKTVVMRIKFPLTRQYEMLLFGNGITTGVHQLIRNSTANAIGVWPWNQLLDVTGFDGLVTLVLPMKASLMQVYTSNGKFGSVTAGTGNFHHIWGDPGNDRGVTFGSLFYVLDGFRSAAECRSLAYDPYQVFEPANQSPLTIGTAAAGGGVTGDLAAQESGSDTAAITGTVLVEGDLSAQESGADTAALTGTVTVQGALSAQESGADTAAFTGSMAISGDLAAVEVGSDTGAFTGSVLVAGTLSVQESGSDTATILGTEPSEITGDLSAQESGSDTAAITGQVHVAGVLSVQESGSDTGAFTGTAPATCCGTLEVQEVGSDTAVILGTLLASGDLAVQETGADGATIVGSVVVSGSLTTQESGSDTLAFTGIVPSTGNLSAQETGSDTAFFSYEEPDLVGNLAVQEGTADKASILGLFPACTQMSTYDAAQAKLNAALIDVFGESVMFDPTGYQYPVTAIFEVTGPENSGSRSRDVQDIGNTESYRPRPYLMMRSSDVEDLDIKARQTVIVRGKNMTVVSDPVNDGQCMTMVYVRGDF